MNSHVRTIIASIALLLISITVGFFLSRCNQKNMGVTKKQLKRKHHEISTTSSENNTASEKTTTCFANETAYLGLCQRSENQIRLACDLNQVEACAQLSKEETGANTESSLAKLLSLCQKDNIRDACQAILRKKGKDPDKFSQAQSKLEQLCHQNDMKSCGVLIDELGGKNMEPQNHDFFAGVNSKLLSSCKSKNVDACEQIVTSWSARAVATDVLFSLCKDGNATACISVYPGTALNRLDKEIFLDEKVTALCEKNNKDACLALHLSTRERVTLLEEKFSSWCRQRDASACEWILEHSDSRQAVNEVARILNDLCEKKDADACWWMGKRHLKICNDPIAQYPTN